MRDDYALFNHPSMKSRPLDMASEHLFCQVNSPAIDLPSASLLEEFKTAAQEFVDAADAGAELDKYVAWFKALLA